MATGWNRRLPYLELKPSNASHAVLLLERVEYGVERLLNGLSLSSLAGWPIIKQRLFTSVCMEGELTVTARCTVEPTEGGWVAVEPLVARVDSTSRPFFCAPMEKNREGGTRYK